MFIRSKDVKGHTYYQVVRSYRDGGRVRQQTLASLGTHPTIEQARARALEEYLKRYASGLLHPEAWPRALLLDDLARQWHAQEGTDYQGDARLEEHRKIWLRADKRRRRREASSVRKANELLSRDLKTLGLAPTVRQLKFAYRRRSRDCHPDHGGSDEAMAEINAAYERLLAILAE
jgi:hypothetical protein